MPPDVGLREPSRWLVGDTHKILRLWRERQKVGEIPFRFKCFLDSQKNPSPTEYEDNIFTGLKEPTTNKLVTKKQVVAPESTIESEQPGGEHSRTPSPFIIPPRSDGPRRGIPLDSNEFASSSPTVRNTSPAKTTTSQTTHNKDIYPTPGQSATSTPTPSDEMHGRNLRSQAKAAEEPKKAEKKRRGRKRGT